MAHATVSVHVSVPAGTTAAEPPGFDPAGYEYATSEAEITQCLRVYGRAAALSFRPERFSWFRVRVIGVESGQCVGWHEWRATSLGYEPVDEPLVLLPGMARRDPGTILLSPRVEAVAFVSRVA